MAWGGAPSQDVPTQASSVRDQGECFGLSNLQLMGSVGL